MKVDLNGELIEAQEARVSPFDAGYMYGDGLFDTMRVYRGFPYLLAEHLQRLSREAELLQIPFDADVQAWQNRIRDLLGANNLFETDAHLRIQISRGGSHDIDQVTAEPEDLDPVVFVSARAVSDRVDRIQIEGVRVLAMQSSFARGNFPQIKSLNYLPSIMALRFARAQGYEEAILVNRQNKLLEGSSSNLFLLHGNTLRTPSPRLGLLPGITRSLVIDLAAQQGLKVEEAASELRDLVIADEVFITGSVKEIVPVVGIDTSQVADAQPGPWTRRLQQRYGEEVESARSASAAQG